MNELIGVQGIRGSYTEAAALELHPDTELSYYLTFPDLFESLDKRHIDTAVAAITNNSIGFIQGTLDKLTDPDNSFTITGESISHVQHVLMAPAGAYMDSIKEVHSQAPALGQCNRYLQNTLPRATRVEQHDTAYSARRIAEMGDPRKAAIASFRAAKEYDLAILAESIQDDYANLTRFLELKRREDVEITGQENKTTAILHTPQHAGGLVDALIPFKDAGINISSMQSQFIANSLFEMKFFVDFDAGLHDDRVQEIITKLAAQGYSFDILGTYRAAELSLADLGQ